MIAAEMANVAERRSVLVKDGEKGRIPCLGPAFVDGSLRRPYEASADSRGIMHQRYRV